VSPFSPIKLDRAAEVPLGTQLAWALRARIAGGELGIGERLPGARELAALVGVNVNTVRAVFARLEEDGVLRVVHGSGTFVAGVPGADEPRAAAGAADDATSLAAAVTSEARRRGIDPREVAAALYVQSSEPAGDDGSGADAAPAGDAATRRLLRAEIEQLERGLGELHGAPSLDARPPRPQRAGRLLSTAELAQLRDALAAQLARARTEARAAAAAPDARAAAAPPAGAAEPASARRTTSTRRAGGPARLRWMPEG
jgi:DNA-binding transcriptional regulator YhcF (GntR family)